VLVEHWDKTRGDASWKRMARLGVIGGVGMMMRPQEALWLLLPGVEAAWHVVRGPERRRWLVAGVVLTVAALVAFVPQMLVWWYYTGSPFTPAQVEPFRPTTPFMIVSLFSTRAGLFPWSPICYAAVIGLCFYRRARVPALAMLAIFAVEVYVVSSAWVVTGGYGYGARRLSDGAPLIALGVGLAWVAAESARRRWWRPALAWFVGFCVVANIVAMELLRFRVIASSGAYARSAERFLTDMHAPRPVARFFGAVGYPFVQPVGWIFALWHRAPASAFEGVVGNWFLDRDGQWLQVQSKGMAFDDAARPYALSGLEIASPKGPATVTGPVRLLLPMFAKEAVVVKLVGQIPAAGTKAVRWNGVAAVMGDDVKGARVQVPEAAVEPGVNEVEVTLPVGTVLQRLEFESISEWWRKPKSGR
jgi:hypothetical protein